MSANAVPLANGAMSFDRVCREWRCKYEGDKATSESLEAIAKLVEEYLPEVKKASKDVKVNRLVCGGCLDFKLMTTVSVCDLVVLVDVYRCNVMNLCALLPYSYYYQRSISSNHSIHTRGSLQVPLDDFGPWEASGFAPEAEFLEKLKAIDGVSQVETQTITNMEI